MTTHPKTTYRPKRDETEHVIHMLCDSYPKCFFAEGRHRRPLKKNIAADIIKDKIFEVADELIIAAVDWYKTHIGYNLQTVAGAKRIDLDGNDVGTVTEQEAIAAKEYVDEVYRKRNEAAKEATSPVRVLSQMHNRNQISDDGMKKLDAAPMPVPPRSKATAAPLALEFTPLNETLTAANAAMVGISDPAMRLAVAKALLDMMIEKAQQVKNDLNQPKSGLETRL
jgi:sRNA-binding protein